MSTPLSPQRFFDPRHLSSGGCPRFGKRCKLSKRQRIWLLTPFPPHGILLGSGIIMKIHRIVSFAIILGLASAPVFVQQAGNPTHDMTRQTPGAQTPTSDAS